MIPGRTAICLPLLLVATAIPALATIPLPPEDPADIRKTEERVGAFRLELEEYRQTGPDAWNPPREWKKVRMVWRSADGLSEAVVEDNGYTLSRDYSLKSADGMNHCMGGGLSQYGSGTHPAVYKRAYLEFLKSCGAEPARVKAYGAELDGAFTDYAAAGERLKALASAAFGGLAPRCIQFKQDLFPPMNRQCVRYSKPAAAR
ncbi:MAG TPA: hypothetical protein VFQ67_06525 [Allosphingosinicella sp.]|jgi:hypothetical protein|nr:hypothetical protein [Allosphingosinicella sp.]